MSRQSDKLLFSGSEKWMAARQQRSDPRLRQCPESPVNVLVARNFALV